MGAVESRRRSATSRSHARMRAAFGPGRGSNACARTRATVRARCGRTGDSPWWLCSRWRSASASRPRCSAWSTPSCCGRCPTRMPDRLVMVWTADPGRAIHEAPTSFPTLTDWRNESRLFADMAFWRIHAGNLTGPSEPERVVGAMASANLFPLLGVPPALGRTFTADDGATARGRGRAAAIGDGSGYKSSIGRRGDDGHRDADVIHSPDRQHEFRQLTGLCAMYRP